MSSRTYKAAQSFLLDHLTDSSAAVKQFRWPELADMVMVDDVSTKVWEQ